MACYIRCSVAVFVSVYWYAGIRMRMAKRWETGCIDCRLVKQGVSLKPGGVDLGQIGK